MQHFNFQKLQHKFFSSISDICLPSFYGIICFQADERLHLKPYRATAASKIMRLTSGSLVTRVGYLLV